MLFYKRDIMARWNSEQEARQEILDLIARYYLEYM